MFPGQIQNIGYESHNFIQNVGSMYLFLAIYFLKLFILFIAKLWSLYKGKQSKFYKKLFKQVIFSDLVVLFLEGYMEFCIAVFIRVQSGKALFSDENLPAETFSNVTCCICIFAIVICLPCLLIYTATRNRDTLANSKFEEWFGVLTEGLHLRKKLSLSYYLLFVIRRLLFLILAFYSFQVPVFQIQLLCLLNFFFSIYQGFAMPK